MDALDAQILKELWKGGTMGLATYDPRMSLEKIARGVGVDRKTVRQRLRNWTDCGFLHGFVTVPNARIFGLRCYGGGVRVDDPRRKPAVRDALRRVNGVWDWLDHAGPWIGVGSFAPSEAALGPLRDDMAAIPGVEEVVPPFPSPVPAPTVTLTNLDWRIVDALRRLADGSVTAVAAEVGVSTSTVARRYERLVKGAALVVMPDVDFTHYEGASLGRLLLFLEHDTDPKPIASTFAKRSEVVVAYPVTPGPPHPPLVDLYLQLATPARMDEFVDLGLQNPHVVETEILWPRDYLTFPEKFDPYIASALEADPHAEDKLTASGPRASSR